ncbi:hypothetical protein AMAG_06753 [Allomyces macrogynus ATCC 38327]|uniref:Uncharacterized protein n=1 Tax=Allomyces macrogynus (strain ATCC 38327) TaxID=578462 RepID=A0A0L0SEZ0_ALLM3|nr:hypothetical protein AMAG_06753 [Allomyces macrogynus ATCC 38327]|eukprot:KNE60989.1 hypothetical protein AMAG_06753 [Allomyces macrogynus ATCC 38327]
MAPSRPTHGFVGTSARFLADYLVSCALLASVPAPLSTDLDLQRVFSTAPATLASASAAVPIDTAILALYTARLAPVPLPAPEWPPLHRDDAEWFLHSVLDRDRHLASAGVELTHDGWVQLNPRDAASVIADAIRRSETDPDPSLAARARSVWRDAVPPRPTAWHAVLDRLLLESRTQAPVRTARRLLGALVDLVKRGEVEVVGNRHVRSIGFVEVKGWAPVLVAPLVTSCGVAVLERVVAGMPRMVVSQVDAVRIVTRAAGWTEDVRRYAPARRAAACAVVHVLVAAGVFSDENVSDGVYRVVLPPPPSHRLATALATALPTAHRLPASHPHYPLLASFLYHARTPPPPASHVVTTGVADAVPDPNAPNIVLPVAVPTVVFDPVLGTAGARPLAEVVDMLVRSARDAERAVSGGAGPAGGMCMCARLGVAEGLVWREWRAGNVVVYRREKEGRKRTAPGGAGDGHVRKARRGEGGDRVGMEEVEEGQVRQGEEEEEEEEGARYGLPKDKGDWLVALA